MEEADRLILQALRNLHCDLEDDKVGLGDLSTEQLVEAVVLCIHAIDRTTEERLSRKLPPGMSARFNFGAKLAEECKRLGCPGDLGYQTFLYASENEVRNILIFLIEKLPRNEEVVVSGPDSFLIQMKRGVSLRVEQSLKLNNSGDLIETKECEPFCGCYQCYPMEQRKSLYDILPKETRNSSIGSPNCKGFQNWILPSILDTHAHLISCSHNKNGGQSHNVDDDTFVIVKAKFAEEEKMFQQVKESRNESHSIKPPSLDQQKNIADQKPTVKEDSSVQKEKNEQVKKQELRDNVIEKEKLLEEKLEYYKNLGNTLKEQRNQLDQQQQKKIEIEKSL